MASEGYAVGTDWPISKKHTWPIWKAKAGFAIDTGTGLEILWGTKWVAQSAENSTVWERSRVAAFLQGPQNWNWTLGINIDRLSVEGSGLADSTVVHRSWSGTIGAEHPWLRLLLESAPPKGDSTTSASPRGLVVAVAPAWPVHFLMTWEHQGMRWNANEYVHQPWSAAMVIDYHGFLAYMGAMQTDYSNSAAIDTRPWIEAQHSWGAQTRLTLGARAFPVLALKAEVGYGL